jgi:21S rRNA (uridine2791-2'-O)-methyltransferase
LSRTSPSSNLSSNQPVPTLFPLPSKPQTRLYATKSTRNWTARQSSDPYTKLARVQNLKSRAAFKLLELHEKHRLFRPGQTVVDLGFAPGSWSQVAIDLVKPGGRVLGVDLIPAQPPKGVSAIQGDFLSEEVQREVRRFVAEDSRGRLRRLASLPASADGTEGSLSSEILGEASYVDYERGENAEDEDQLRGDGEEEEYRCVDVVLSDMSEPWEIVDGLYKRTLSNPYYRLMNTSGNPFRDHVGSMVSASSILIS